MSYDDFSRYMGTSEPYTDARALAAAALSLGDAAHDPARVYAEAMPDLLAVIDRLRGDTEHLRSIGAVVALAALAGDAIRSFARVSGQSADALLAGWPSWLTDPGQNRPGEPEPPAPGSS